jgi:V8-like Glu-specific endopeptidase
MNTFYSAVTGGAAAIIVIFGIPSSATAADSSGATLSVVNRSAASSGGFSQPDKVYSAEEIRNAKPQEWSPASGADPRYQSGSTFREEPPPITEPMKSKKPGLPNANADREAQRAFSADWRLMAEMEKASKSAGDAKSGFDAGLEDAVADGVNFGTADVFTSYRGNYWSAQWKAFPWKVVGKLLIDGAGYCTAQSITGAPKNIIVTAAHCVHDRTRFYSGWTFVPAERNGVAPYGQYRWASARILNGWIAPGGRRYDVAIIRLQNNPSTGRPVSFYTGWLGWRINAPYVRNLHSIGYASNFSTQWTTICTAESFSAGCEGVDVTIKGCDMTFGSSGGGWIQGYKPFEVSGWVESVVSGPSCAGTCGQTYVGPHFSSSNLGLLCSAEGGCTTP